MPWTMTAGPRQPNVSRPVYRWSNRILLLALAGILFLTLYPFRFDFSVHLARSLFPFSLGGSTKRVGPLDDLLNILLFVPFGFGLAQPLWERRKPRLRTVASVFAAGALLSYTIELLQIYIPQRDSGWEDVLTNSVGALVGAALLEWLGKPTLQLLSEAERQVASWFTWRRAALVISLYVGFWCVVAMPLQKKARPSNWSLDSRIVIGNSASTGFLNPWKGQVREFEVWDRAVPSAAATKIPSNGALNNPGSNPVVSYALSGSAPFQDQRHFLFDLSWAPQAPTSVRSDDLFLDGKSWLVTPASVAVLVDRIEMTGQFSLHIICRPVETSEVRASILSISARSGTTDLELQQQDTSLVSWFRAPLTTERARMSLVAPKIFAANETRNILISYDGRKLRLFLDGKLRTDTYELGAAAAMARFIRHIKPPELEGYRYIFYAMIFLPIGSLVGVAWRTITTSWIGRLTLFLVGLIPSSVGFEVALVHVRGGSIATADVFLSLLWALAGSLWINADRTYCERPEVRAS